MQFVLRFQKQTELRSTHFKAGTYRDAGQKTGHGEAIDWVQVESKIGSIVDSVIQSRLQAVLEEMDRKENKMELLLKRYQRDRSRWCRNKRT